MKILILIISIFVSSCTTKARFSGYCSAPKIYKDKSTASIVNAARKINSDKSERRAIAFGIFGSKDKYTKGLLNNITIAKDVYPNWEVVIFAHSITVPKEIIEKAKDLGARVILSERYNNASSRFEIADLEEYDRFIVRDADSRLMHREAAAVADWIKEDWAILHGMRDTQGHQDPLLGGMWGARSALLREKLKINFKNSSLAQLYLDYSKDKGEAYYGLDQEFLTEVIVKSVGEDEFLSHETIKCHSFEHSRGFPITRSISGPFIGQVIEWD